MASGPRVQLWSTAISTNASNGRKIFFRFANVFSPAFDRASQPIRIIISWKYHSATGQPEGEEHQQMIQFEDVLGPVLDQGALQPWRLSRRGRIFASGSITRNLKVDSPHGSTMRSPGVHPSPLKSKLPTIRNGEPMRSLEQEFVKATTHPHNLFGTNRRGTCVPGRSYRNSLFKEFLRNSTPPRAALTSGLPTIQPELKRRASFVLNERIGPFTPNESSPGQKKLYSVAGNASTHESFQQLSPCNRRLEE
jgi:hypothetical protein